ncbi:MAG: hypothetical protein RL213_1438 [Bacteroidota bacterium]|jgi:hypothetical protein
MKRIAGLSLLLLLSLTTVEQSSGQCAMCRRNVESNKETRNNKVGTGLNKGILYLMSIPYVIGAIGIAVWMKRRKQE